MENPKDSFGCQKGKGYPVSDHLTNPLEIKLYSAHF